MIIAIKHGISELPDELINEDLSLLLLYTAIDNDPDQATLPSPTPHMALSLPRANGRPATQLNKQISSG